MKRKKFLYLLITLLTMYQLSAHAQKAQKKQAAIKTRGSDTDSKKDANSFYTEGDYYSALDAYLNIYKTNPKSTEVNYRLGICYLSTNKDKSKAIPYLEYVAKQKDAPKEIYYYLGRAYHFANNFEEAIKNYMKVPANEKWDTKIGIEPQRQIAMCKNGMRMVKNPLDLKIENMGKDVNSPYEDYNPFIVADESTLYFTSRRKNTTGGVMEDDIQIPADVYSVAFKDNKWQKPKSIGAVINTEYDEECVGISSDGQKLFLYLDNLDFYGDLFVSTLKGKVWQTPETLGENVNSKDFETGACISPDGNTLFFASDRKEGSYGGFDIYKSKKLPTGAWGLPINLGPVINTKNDEEFPCIFHDGKTLYFASNRPESMGGYDIFKSTFDESNNAWSKPENIGYPLNTTEDNFTISFTTTGQYAYFAALRPEGVGGLDIYRGTFNDVKSQSLTVIKGYVITGDTINPVSAQISLFDNPDSDPIGLYTPNSSTGSFIIIASPGKYHLEIVSDGFKDYKEEIIIPERNQPAFLQKKFTLLK